MWTSNLDLRLLQTARDFFPFENLSWWIEHYADKFAKSQASPKLRPYLFKTSTLVRLALYWSFLLLQKSATEPYSFSYP